MQTELYYIALTMPSSFHQRKHPKGVILTPPDIFANISQLTGIFIYSYVCRDCLRNTFRGILEGYFGEKVFVLGQSSVKL